MITNKSNVSIALIPFLLRDDYDASELLNAISATALIKSTKQTLLSRRVQNKVQDVLDFVSSRRGSAIHDSVEKSWTNNPQLERILQSVNISDSVIKRIKVNPEKPDPDSINIYVEQRNHKELLGFNVNGKFDLLMDGRLMDIKTTSVFSWIKGKNDKNYQLQGSIYRWLNPELVTDDYFYIQMIFTDWSKARAVGDKYPPAPIVEVKIPLLSLQETEEYIKTKLKALITYKDSDESEMPNCTDEELWRNESIYKLYKTETSKRAAKVFDSKQSADEYVAAGGDGIIKEFKGKAKACDYCYANEICNQRKEEQSNDSEPGE